MATANSGSAGASLTVQTILYRNDPAVFLRSMASLARAVELARRDGTVQHVHVRIGDCSPDPVLDDARLGQVSDLFAGQARTSYVPFGDNLGHGGAHNRLFEALDTEFVLILNPDTHLGPTAISALLSAMRSDVGAVDARQLPLEHPKEYDSRTGYTSWASGACMLTRKNVIDATGGFDDRSFFLYGDDVDFCWRARLIGYRIVFEPSARVFHDKRLGESGSIAVSDEELYYSAESALFLAHKYSRPDIVSRVLSDLKNSSAVYHQNAVAEFVRRQQAGELPEPIDSDHVIAEFVAGAYGAHRF